MYSRPREGQYLSEEKEVSQKAIGDASILPNLSVITCHPTSPELPGLQNSFVAHVGPDGSELICTVAASSIAKAYNQGAARAKGKVLLFTHSDVEILCSRRGMEEAMATAAADNCGVIGIAGARVLREDAVWWSAKDQLSGACMHTDKGQYWMTAFGPYGQVVVLDGVLLMMSRAVFDKVGGFDESIPGWDYYDVDFTLRSYQAGFINITFPLQILHRSIGDTSKKPGWHMNRGIFLERWKAKLPVVLEGRTLGAPKFSPSGGAQ